MFLLIYYKLEFFILTVSVINKNNGEELSSATVEAFVEAVQSGLIAIISGESSRSIPSTSTLVLDESKSYDPDDP